MSFQVKLKAVTIRLLVLFSFVLLLATAPGALKAQTAETAVQAPAAAATAEVSAPAEAAQAPAAVTATTEASVSITGELKGIELQAPAAQTAEVGAGAVETPAAAPARTEEAVMAAPSPAPASPVETPAQPQPAPAAETKPAAAPAARPQAPPEAKKEAPAKPSVKVVAKPDTLFIRPGETLDISKITLEARTAEGKSEPVKIDSWSADTGSVNLTTYAPPSADFRGIVSLFADYNAGGVTGRTEVTVKVRKEYMEDRLIVLYMALILAAIVLLSINSALSGKNYFIRRIGGLNAIDEAIGRSTEMGKPVLYLTGLSDMSAISTIASISILSYVARKTAEYETSLLVPCCRSLVMNTAREVVKESYLEAGKPDAYNAENIKYITDDQFGFVSGVDGIMLRERPAANFYLGHFMAESLIYAETGNSIGAIQIAGTSEFSQIPFFVAACDYCLIGEELFAASAYLSRKPKDVGTLRGQDIAKLAIMAIIIIGVVLETVCAVNPGMASSLGFYKSIFQTK